MSVYGENWPSSKYQHTANHLVERWCMMAPRTSDFSGRAKLAWWEWEQFKWTRLIQNDIVFTSGCPSSDYSMLCDFSPSTSCRTVGHWPSWHDINSSWNIEYSGGSWGFNHSETIASSGVHEAKEKCASLHWCLGNISASRQLLSCLSLLEYCLSVFLIQVHSCRTGFSEQNSCHIHQFSCAYSINYDGADEQFAFSCGWRMWWFLGPEYPATLPSNLYVVPPYLQMASIFPTSAGVYMLGKDNWGAPSICMWIPVWLLWILTYSFQEDLTSCSVSWHNVLLGSSDELWWNLTLASLRNPL